MEAKDIFGSETKQQKVIEFLNETFPGEAPVSITNKKGIYKIQMSKHLVVIDSAGDDIKNIEVITTNI
jgi:hypothetical protein